jgi:hypothetical protein
LDTWLILRYPKNYIAFVALNAEKLSRYFKSTEVNRRSIPGTREKVSSRRINLEGNAHAQESNASQLPV